MFMQNQKDFAVATNAAAMIDLEAVMFPAALTRSGLIEGTRVEAADGWRAVETLMRGDAVYTLDGGLRQITAIHRKDVLPARALRVPGGALDNCSEITLLPGQHVLVEDDRAEDVFGSPLAMIPAAALAGYRGIEWLNWQGAKAEIVTLEFEEEEVVYANTGMLLHCPEASQLALPRPISKFFNVLAMADAREMVALMNDAGAADFAQVA